MTHHGAPGLDFKIRAADGTELAIGSHVVEGDGPVVLVLHGLLSHMGWYRGLAESLAAEGVTVYLADRRGAGSSGGLRGHAMSWKTLRDDAISVVAEISRRHPGAPIHAIGISLGAAVALCAGLAQPEIFERVTLFSPGLAPAFKLPLLRRLRLLRRAFTDPTRTYDLPFSIEQLTKDPAWRERLRADPLRLRQATARFLVEVFRMQRYIAASAREIRMPILALLAGDDEVVSTERALEILRATSGPAVRIEVVEGASHVLPSMLSREQILQRILPWIRGAATAGSDRVTVTRTRARP